MSAIAPMPGRVLGGRAHDRRARALTAGAGSRSRYRADASWRRTPRRPASRGRRARRRARPGSPRARSRGRAAGCSPRPALELGPQRRARVPVLPPRVAPAAVRDDPLLHHLGLSQDRLPRVADPRQTLPELGQHRVGLLDVVRTLLGHHATPSSAGSWSIEVIARPANLRSVRADRSARGTCRPRAPGRRRTPGCPRRRPTARGSPRPAHREPEDPRVGLLESLHARHDAHLEVPTTPRSSRSRSSHSSKFDTTPSSRPASRSRSRTGVTSSNRR